MKIFDDIPRIDLDAKTHFEPGYRYVNRSARSPVARVRELIQDWADRYPDLVTPEWLGRFRSNDDQHYLGALFELYIRALLDAQGMKVEREPAGENAKRIEFSVIDDDGPVFVIECRLALGPEFVSPAKKRLRRLYDEIDKMESGAFFLGVDVGSIGEQDISAGEIRRFLRTELAQRDPDAVTAEYIRDGLLGLPRLTWERGGWTLTFTPIAKKIEARGKPGHRILGTFTDSTRPAIEPLDTRGPLIDALKKKASKYGRPAVPYVIALGAFDFWVEDESVASALFGSEAVVWNSTNPDLTTARFPNGFWAGKSGPQHQRVSAVLFVPHLYAHMVASAKPKLWHNPWADHPLDPRLWAVDQMVPNRDTSTLEEQPGRSARELFGLPDDWPGWAEEQRTQTAEL